MANSYTEYLIPQAERAANRQSIAHLSANQVTIHERFYYEA